MSDPTREQHGFRQFAAEIGTGWSKPLLGVDDCGHIAALNTYAELLLGWREQGANVNEIGKTLFMFGSYAGEVLRNIEPGKWFKPEDDGSGR